MARGGAAIAAMAALLLGSFAGHAQPRAWNPQPWLQDLDQARAAVETKYANLEWQLTEREFDVGALFGRAAAALRQASSDDEAKAVFDRLVSRLADGHVSISWPRRAATQGGAQRAAPAHSQPVTIDAFCRARGYDPPRPGIGQSLSGYVPIEAGDVLPAGIVRSGKHRAGILRIAKFEPGGSPSLCAEAVARLKIPVDKDCDAACSDAIMTHAYRRLTLAVDQRLKALKEAGTDVLIVDLTGNGGGSEWVQAVARMLTAQRLESQRMGFVRGPHWVRTWTRLAERLRGFAASAPADDRRRLLAWAAEADSARAEAERKCPVTGGCPWLGRAGYATGLVGSARPGEFEGKAWGPWVFNPAQYPYREGAWDGPVIVLVDDYTGSAAEELPALLQDSGAALIVGSRTAGMGCGHTWGGSPTRLTNSGATLELPDCARFRADGSNEVRGVIPDRLVGWRATDGPTLRARMLDAVLPAALADARRLHRRHAKR